MAVVTAFWCWWLDGGLLVVRGGMRGRRPGVGLRVDALGDEAWCLVVLGMVGSVGE